MLLSSGHCELLPNANYKRVASNLPFALSSKSSLKGFTVKWTETLNSQSLNSATMHFTISMHNMFVYSMNAFTFTSICIPTSRANVQVVCMLVGKHPLRGKHVHSHLTACRTLLSRGLRLGSLVDERMPVPQLLARVFLIHQNENRLHRTQNRGKTKIVVISL